MTKILEFSTQADAESCLATINQMAADWWQAQGYTVIDGELIGKKNGVIAPESARTITWDVVKESPDNTFYFSSLSNDARFPDWKDTYTQYGNIAYTEKDFPDAWVPAEEQV